MRPLPAWRRRLKLVRVSFHIGLGVFVAGSIAAYFALRRQPVRAVRFGAWWKARFARTLGVRVRVQGEPVAGPVFLVANHISWLDILVVGGTLPVNFVAKAEIAGWPLAGWMVAQGGTVFIARGSNQAAEIAAEIEARLAAGGAVLVFAEGTTSDGGQVRPFFPRLFAPVAGQERPIQPVALRYVAEGPVHPTAPFVGDDPFPAHLLRLLHEESIDVELTFCPPIPGTAGDRRALATQAREAIRGALGLPEETEAEAGGGRRRTAIPRPFAKPGDEAAAKRWS